MDSACLGKISSSRSLAYYLVSWVGLLLLGLSGCRSDPGTMVLQADFEQELAGVLPGPEGVTDTIAHSGARTAQLLPTTDYGATIIKSWAEMGSPRQLRVGGWLWLPHGQVHTALVIHAERNGETIYYHIQNLHDVVKRYKSWQLVHQTHFFPPDMQPTDQVKIYVWQWGYHYRFYIDDLFLEKLR